VKKKTKKERKKCPLNLSKGFTEVTANLSMSNFALQKITWLGFFFTESAREDLWLWVLVTDDILSSDHIEKKK
jgi:hypothetical protein